MRDITKQIGQLAIADGQQAMKVVRGRASEWRIAPDRIGILGFSAYGRVTVGVALEHDAESGPNFAAPIYGALWEEISVPADAPPLIAGLIVFASGSRLRALCMTHICCSRVCEKRLYVLDALAEAISSKIRLCEASSHLLDEGGNHLDRFEQARWIS